MKNIMFDLETFGTEPGCVIRSIGAVEFDPYSDFIGDSFYANIDRRSCEEFGLTVDPDTEAWWSRQSAESQAALLVEPKQLGEAVFLFHLWFRHYGGENIWAHGPTFDEVLWRAAAKAVGENVPWGYRNTRDTRTVYDICAFDTRTVAESGVCHNALDDARYQARCVQAALRKGSRPWIG